MNAYRFELTGKCPVDGTVDSYQVVVKRREPMFVEELLKVAREVAAEKPRIQEEITRELADKFAAEVTTVGYHSGVHVESVSGTPGGGK